MENKSIIATLTSCALALALAGTAHAQQDPAQAPDAQPPGAPAMPERGTEEPLPGMGNVDPGAGAEATSIADAEMRAADLMDMSVSNMQDEALGSVQDLLITRDGRITHAIIGQGGVLGVGQELYAVPFDRLQISADRKQVVINVPKEQFASEFSAFEEPAAGEDPSQGIESGTDEPGATEPGAADPAGGQGQM